MGRDSLAPLVKAKHPIIFLNKQRKKIRYHDMKFYVATLLKLLFQDIGRFKF